LGARRGDVLALMVKRGAALTLAGIVIGTGVSLAATRILETLLFEVKPQDPAAYIAMTAALAIVTLAAC
jgi:hypothetical protein